MKTSHVLDSIRAVVEAVDPARQEELRRDIQRVKNWLNAKEKPGTLSSVRSGRAA